MYKLDANEAKKADVQGKQKIERIGKYKGTVERAVLIISSKGTEGVEIHFKSDADEYAYFHIYTKNSNGEMLQGYKQIMALMTVLRIKETVIVDKNYDVYDRNLNETVKKTMKSIQNIEGKKLGVLIETEESEYNGTVSLKTLPAMFFDADTEFCATEILNRETEPQIVAKRVVMLKHKPLSVPQNRAQQSRANQSQNNQAVDYLDNIPF